ncbi:hypothetical protein R1flu_012393 [Riccia fluitans]|uniref:Nudix hydrolase domain-containing protein n=1 Tax=Riccia fluitans TaxID=41844 RepID=A0ABD1ZAT8_9MARC
MESVSGDEESVIAISPTNGVIIERERSVSKSQSEVKEMDFDLLLICPVPLGRSDLSVDFGSAYDRQAHPDPELEQAINKIWEQRVAAQPSLFNGSKFRYGGFREVRDSELKIPIKVSLCLGLTDYRTFTGTNLSSKWQEFLVPSGDDLERCRHTGDPLGNAAVVETTDGKIVVLQRSADVGEFPGTLVFPGGHPEPEEAGIKSHKESESTNKEELEKKITEEMFEGIIREVVEETGIPASSMTDPVFMGCSRRKQNVRPAVFFYLRTALTSTQVLSNYQHAEHSYESTALYTLSPEELVEVAKRMPGCHQGGAALYQLLRVSAPQFKPMEGHSTLSRGASLQNRFEA